MKTSLKTIFPVTLIYCIFTFHAIAQPVPDFEAMEKWGGGFIEGHLPQHGFFVYRSEKHTYLVLKSLSGYSGSSAQWNYVTHIIVPNYDDINDTLVYSLCTINNKPDTRIAALVELEPKKVLSKIKSAWKANLEKQKIEKIPVKGIQCINEGYGV